MLYQQDDKQTFIEKLEIVDWRILLCQLEEVDDMCFQFTKTFLELSRKCIPTKTITVRINDRPWFNSEIRYQEQTQQSNVKISWKLEYL